jgi:hypothetical protein
MSLCWLPEGDGAPRLPPAGPVDRAGNGAVAAPFSRG